MKKQVLLLTVLLMSSALFAQKINFDGAASTAWEDNDNWGDATAPTIDASDEEVRINEDKSIDISTAVTVGKLKWGKGENTVTIKSTGSLTILRPGDWSGIGWDASTVNINIEVGGLIDFGGTHAWISWAEGANANIDVAGTFIAEGANFGFSFVPGNTTGKSGITIQNTGVVRLRQLDPATAENNAMKQTDCFINIIGDGLLTIMGDEVANVESHGDKIQIDGVAGGDGLLVARFSADTNMTYVYSLGGSGVHDVLSLEDHATLDFSVYPNPSSNNIKIQSKSAISNVQLFNSLGQKVLDVDGKSTIDISGLNAGFYVLKAKDIDGNLGVKRVIKQ